MSCPSCPGAAPITRLAMIKKMSNILSDGHRHIAEIYRTLAADTSIEEDKAAYMTASRTQDGMAEKTLEIVVPDDLDEEALNV